VGPRAGLDTEARGRLLSPLPRIEPPSPGSPARSRHYTELPRITQYLLLSAIQERVPQRNSGENSSITCSTPRSSRIVGGCGCFRC
jgi:hypothetical protein